MNNDDFLKENERKKKKKTALIVRIEKGQLKFLGPLRLEDWKN